ncbi:MAG TPA: VOC family protein [Gammaproteobacteria bacterium]
MKPRFKVITIAVGNLERSLAFYRDGLGLHTEGIIGTEFEDGAVVFIPVNRDQILALYPRKALAKDAGIPLDAPSAAEFSLGHVVNSREAVDAIIRQAKKAGARVTAAAREKPWGGYSGYFQDPDGHLWEVAWNPAWVSED